MLIQGNRIRLHKGSVCRLVGHDDLASVVDYDSPTKQWRVRVKGTEVLMPEDRLQLCFSLLPSSLNKQVQYAQVAFCSSCL